MSRRTVFQLLLAFVTITAILFFTGGLFAQGNRDAAFERVKEVQQRHTEKLMAKKGVVGTAIGHGQVGQPIMLVLVEHGGVPDIPEELEGVPVRPLVTGKIYALKPPADKPDRPGKPPKDEDPALDPTSRWPRPVPIGVSTGHPDITAGTIGCRVTDGTNVYALSNNHVYADENEAKIDVDNVLQPGIYDGGLDPDDAIGTLADFVDIVFTASAVNIIDAAIAQCTTHSLGNSTPSDGYGTPKSSTMDAYIGMPVKKYGRTTGQTKSSVNALNAIVDVGYDSGTARFVNQIVIGPGSFSSGGDSGSLIVCNGRGRNKGDDRRPVGLLFAGSSLWTIANPIDEVLYAFGVSIDGE